MDKIAIIGLGLMGGSLGLAAGHRRLAGTVVGFARRAVTRREARRRRVVDQAVDRLSDAVHGADLVVFCLPVLAIPAALKICRPYLKKGCVVTDVGSTKAELVTACNAVLKGTDACFVGSHPIAGSEEAGIAAARESLYESAVVVVTPAVRRDERSVAVRTVKQFWRAIGARVVLMSPSAHDQALARTSHLPHLTAAMLVRILSDGGADADALCGSGFRDTTRIAAGSEVVWHDILKSNKGPIGKELASLEQLLKRVRGMLGRQDFAGLRRFLAASCEKRQSLEKIFRKEGPRA